MDKEHHHLDLLGRKVFSSSSFQFRIINYQALMAKYNFLKHTKFAEFIDSLLQQDRAHFQALIDEDKLIAKTPLQSTVNATDISSRAMTAAIFMHRESWLHESKFPREVQNTIKDLSFDELQVFNQKTGKSSSISSRTQELPSAHWGYTCLPLRGSFTAHHLDLDIWLSSFSTRSPVNHHTTGRGFKRSISAHPLQQAIHLNLILPAQHYF